MIYWGNRAASVLFYFLKALPDCSRVILPANICPVVGVTVIKAGLVPEFVDISNNDLCLEQEKTLTLLIKEPEAYSAVLYINSYGSEPDTTHFFEEIKKTCPHVLIIEDRCLNIPEFEYSGGADAALFSTGYAKYADISFGGFLISDRVFETAEYSFDPKSLDDLEKKITFCYDNRVSLGSEIVSANWLDLTCFRSDIEAYMMKVKSKVEKAKYHKRLLNEIYAHYLPADICFEKCFQNWRFNIAVNNKAEVLGRIFKNGYFASSHYAPVSGVFTEEEFVNSTQLYGRIINLFNDSYYSENQAENTAKIILKSL